MTDYATVTVDLTPPPPTLDEFRVWLRDCRRALNLSQRELGERTGIPTIDVNRIENGVRGVRWEEGWKFVSALTEARRVA